MEGCGSAWGELSGRVILNNSTLSPRQGKSLTDLSSLGTVRDFHSCEITLAETRAEAGASGNREEGCTQAETHMHSSHRNTHVHTHTRAHSYTCSYICTCAHRNTHAHAHSCTQLHVHTATHAHTAHVNTSCRYAHITYLCTHIDIHTCTYMHTLVLIITQAMPWFLCGSSCDLLGLGNSCSICQEEVVA